MENSTLVDGVILNKLREEYVVKFELSEDRTELVITELCDEHYNIKLNVEDAESMLNELKNFVFSMNKK